MKYWIAAGAFVIACLIATRFITIFVVQPIGAVPEGRTLIVWRTSELNFIDSADAMCERKIHGVSLICRGSALAAIVQNGSIIARLPYSETLYKYSTGGATYDR